MNHCRQCRADAVGLLSADMTEESVKWLKEASRKEEEPLGAPLEVNDLVAVATMEGVLVNRHLGETPSFEIYQYNGGAFTHVEQRVSPHAGTGDARWNELADRLHDCTALFVSGVGKRPKAVLEERGLAVYSVEGMIQEVFSSFVKGTGLNHLTHRELAVTGAGCSGSGCGA
jgi:nitrogen fixation protein NifB